MDALTLLGRFGYAIFFAAAAAEYLAFPIAAVPILLLGGSLVAWGHLDWWPLLGSITAGALVGDVAWYWVGRWRGSAVVGWACRFSLNRDVCVSKTKAAFGRFGSWALLVAKFVPGVGALAAPTAGLARLSFRMFILLDLVAAAAWAAVWTGAGYALGGSFSNLTSGLAALNRVVFIAVPGAIAGVAIYRWARRSAEARAKTVARLEPRELDALRRQGEPVTIVDVRTDLDFARSDLQVAGAIRISPARVEEELSRLRRDLLLALYCT